MTGNAAVVERGMVSTQIKVPVDDRIYSMQDKYELPYTTVDKDGNTVVSVVEKVDLDYPTDLNSPVKATLHLKVFKNETIGVTPVPTTGNEKHPHEREFLSATMNSLEYNMQSDRYMKAIYKTLLGYQRYVTPSVTSPISSLRYTPYNDDTAITSATSTSVTCLKPYHTTSALNWSNWTGATDSTYNHHCKYWEGLTKAHPVVNAVELMKEILRTRQAPAAIIRHDALRKTTDIREIRARQTLRRLIGEVAYNRYSVRGFITFKGESGRTYQIFPGHKQVVVWEDGKKIEQLCVVLTGDFPPTDSVLMRLLLIQESEDRFKGIANVTTIAYAPGLNRAAHIEVANQKLSLPEIFADLKVKQRNSLMRLVA